MCNSTARLCTCSPRCVKQIWICCNRPGKLAGSHPEAFWQPEMGWIVYAGSNFPHPIWFHFSKEGIDHIMQNWLRSNLDGLVMDWPNTHSLEACRCIGINGPSFWQEATGLLPVFHCQTRLCSSTDVLDHIVQNQPWSNLVLTDCVRFWQTDPVRRQGSVQESSGQLLANASNLTRTGCESDPACLLGNLPQNRF